MSQRHCTSLLVLAGSLCSGKTTLANALVEQTGAQVVSARAELRRLGASEDRRDLQDFGAALERRTGGAWLAAAVPTPGGQSAPVIVDSARTLEQIAGLRAIMPSAVVIFLTAPVEERKRRYEIREDPADRGLSFESALSAERTEVAQLADHADVQVETGDKTPKGVAAYVLRLVRLCGA